MKNLFRVLKNKLRNISVEIAGYQLEISVFKKPENSSVLAAAKLRQIKFLSSKYSELLKFTALANQHNADNILDFLFQVIPLFEANTKEVSLRNAYKKLLDSAGGDSDLSKSLIFKIAKSNLRSGIPDRAKVLKDDPDFNVELETQSRLSDAAYGAPLLANEWNDSSRGAALVYFFQNHTETLRGKKVLHFSPEFELAQWIRHSLNQLGMQAYVTTNIEGKDVDLNLDITEIDLPESSFDFIVCHRVLEHISDDKTAFSELHRILTVGGMLQISVPQSMHKDITNEWIIPDHTHDGHVRQYGADFSEKLTAAGFEVELDDWLLKQNREQLLGVGAYPMRMYHARKKT